MIIIQNSPINLVPTALHTTHSEGLNLPAEQPQEYPPANNYTNIRDALLRLGIKATYRAIQSDNFVLNTSGWKLFADGSLEANEGTFRGKLIAGSIHIPDETTANSFHTETDGNSYWGCNAADWASDNDNAKAYVKKDGTAKFGEVTVIGSSTKYFNFDGTNADAVGFRNVQLFTYGETIAVNKILCFKNQTQNDVTTADAYVDQSNPGINYPTSWLYTGVTAANETHIYMKFPTPPTGHIKALLWYYVATTGSVLQGFTVKKVDATWDENAITWNNKPAVSDFDFHRDTENNSVGWHSVDITNLTKGWEWGEYTNYGLQLRIINATTDYKLYGRDQAYPAYIEYTKHTFEEKVYLADNTDYKTSNYMVGISKESGVNNNVKSVFIGSSPLSIAGTAGARKYLGINGGFSGDVYINPEHSSIQIGKQLTASIFLLDIVKPELFLWTTEAEAFEASGTKYAYAPPTAKKAIIFIDYVDSNNNIYDGSTQIELYRYGVNDTTWKYKFTAGTAALSMRCQWDENTSRIKLTYAHTGATDYTSVTVSFFE